MTDDRDNDDPVDRERTQWQSQAQFAQLLRFQDVTVMLMVVATIASAYATWQSANITANIYRRSERPYLGVESLRLNAAGTGDPYVALVYRDFGHVPASDAVLTAWASADGRLVSYDPSDRAKGRISLHLGVLSPQVPQLFDVYFPSNLDGLLRNGKVRFIVSVLLTSRDVAGEYYCYRMDFRYYSPADTFDPAGGSDRCGED